MKHLRVKSGDRRWSTAGLLLMLILGAFAAEDRPAWAGVPPSTLPAAEAGSYTFAFHEAQVGLIADEILGRALGLTYSVDPDVTAKISLRIEQRLTKAQLLETFESALAANGVAVVRNGDSLLLTSPSKARQTADVHMAGDHQLEGGYEVVAVPLTYATPSEVAKALEAMGRQDLVVYTDDKLGLIVLGGSDKEIDAAQHTLRVLDQSGFQDSRIRWFELNTAPAQTVADELHQILQSAGASGVTVLALRRLNGLLVFARTPKGIDEAGSWIQRLDVQSKEEALGLWVYRPMNLTADALAATLNSVVGGGQGDTNSTPALPSQGPGDPGGKAPSSAATPSQPPPGPGVSLPMGAGAVRIGVSKESNTLIITATNSEWLQIKRILDEIDRTPDQVLIQASILEVTLTDELQFGVDWSFVGANGKLNIASVANRAGAIAPSFPGLSLTYLDKNIDVAVKALKSLTEVEVISAPKIVTLDNHTAKLEVGDQVPVTVQSSQGTTTPNAPLVVNTEYRDTGVILNVTPRISGEDKVVLDIQQEVSSVAKTTSSGIDSPTIQQRRLQGTLLLNDGAAVPLGGLISRNRSKTNTGVPWAKDLPLIGAAFRSTDHALNRTELIVLITAKIMRGPAAQQKVMSDLLADMKDLQSHGLLPN